MLTLKGIHYQPSTADKPILKNINFVSLSSKSISNYKPSGLFEAPCSSHNLFNFFENNCRPRGVTTLTCVGSS